jgi:hypothetical protein
MDHDWISMENSETFENVIERQWITDHWIVTDHKRFNAINTMHKTKGLFMIQIHTSDVVSKVTVTQH